MLIRSIKLINYRQFKNTSIDFSCNPDKKFTVILGDNTFGKTTFVRAFIWCLYRLNDYSDKILLNSDVADDMRIDAEEIVRVKLELDHDNCSYIIDTVEKYRKSNSGSIVVSHKAHTTIQKSTNILEGYRPVPENLVNVEIESILGSELKNYFFYDGENNKIETITKTGKLKDAVSNLLGLHQIELLEFYYNPRSRDGIYSHFTNKMLSVDENLSNNVKERYDEKLDERSRIIEEIENNANEITNLKIKKEEKEQFLDTLQDLREHQERKHSLEHKIETTKREKEDLFLSLIHSFYTNETFLKILFAKSFSKFDLENKLQVSSFATENSLSNISETAVDELISRGYCLCGTRIENGSEAYRHLIESKEHMQPRNYGKYTQVFIDGEKINIGFAKNNLGDLCNICDRLLTSIEDIDLAKDELNILVHSIGGGERDFDVTQQEINDISIQIGIREGRNRELNERLPNLDREIDSLASQLDRILTRNEVNKAYKLCNEYVSTIYEKASNKMNQLKTDIRQSLERETNDIFKKMYHGNRNIIIDENFKASTVICKDGLRRNLDASTGLETVKNFAFVAGLMKLAKSTLNRSNDELEDEKVADEAYPLVMDAPFSSTDPTHIKNICINLPDYCNQIILVVMKKDFDNALASISDKIGKLYHIHKHNETYTTIEDGDLNV